MRLKALIYEHRVSRLILNPRHRQQDGQIPLTVRPGLTSVFPNVFPPHCFLSWTLQDPDFIFSTWGVLLSGYWQFSFDALLLSNSIMGEHST